MPRSWHVRMAALILLAAAVALAGTVVAGEPRNVILLIGDGMGAEQIKAAGMFANGKEGSLFMETLPHQALVVTCPAYTVPANVKSPATWPAEVSDSAASATAYATGRKVNNGVLSLAIPGDGKPLPTVMERFAAAGKFTALVTTAHLTDATPSAFGAHVKNRGMAKEIAADYLQRSKPNILLGGGDPNGLLRAEGARLARYEVVTDRTGLKSLKLAPGGHVLGLFGSGPMCYEYDYFTKSRHDYDTLPHLTEMAGEALKIAAEQPKVFFMMIEGGCIDKACHPNKLPETVYETVEFDKAVKLAMDFAFKRDDTLVLVVADHETGGLKVTHNNGQGKFPEVTWSTGGHTGANVRLLAFGPGSEKVKGVLDNTDVFRLMTGEFTSATVYQPPTDAPKPVAVPAKSKEREEVPAAK